MGCGWEKKYKQTKWDKMADAQRIARNKEAYEISEIFRNNPTGNFPLPVVIVGGVVVGLACFGGWLWHKILD